MYTIFSANATLNDTQKSIVDAYFDHMETSFLSTCFEHLSEKDKALLLKSILLAIGEETTEQLMQDHLQLCYSESSGLEFMQEPLFSIYETTHRILNKDLLAALDFRLYDVKRYSSLDNINEKMAVSTYLSFLIKKYLASTAHIATENPLTNETHSLHRSLSHRLIRPLA